MDVVKTTGKKGQYTISERAINSILDRFEKDYGFPTCIGNAVMEIPGLEKLKGQIDVQFPATNKKEAEEKAVEWIEKMTTLVVMGMDRMQKCIKCKYFNQCVMMK